MQGERELTIAFFADVQGIAVKTRKNKLDRTMMNP